MAGQLGNLLAAMSLPSMSLGIIPAGAAREGTRWPLEHVTVFDDNRIHVELLAAKVTVTAPGELDIYLRAFARLAGRMARPWRVSRTGAGAAVTRVGEAGGIDPTSRRQAIGPAASGTGAAGPYSTQRLGHGFES
jgi:hypothetical protein